jgi:DNA-binding PadR family transcriptional regulator
MHRTFDHEVHEGGRHARGRGHREHREHHRDFGPPWARHMREGWFGPPRGGRRARRGDVRTAVLALLEEKPAHGYDLIRELEERSGGMWQPSPGSVYPTLQMLEDQGLVTGEESDGKRVYSITDAGRQDLAERRERSGGAAPWDARGDSPEGFGKLMGAMTQLGGAVMQVARGGDTAQIDRVAEIVTDARKKVYALLAED